MGACSTGSCCGWGSPCSSSAAARSAGSSRPYLGCSRGNSFSTARSSPAAGISGGSAGASSEVERKRSARGPSRMLARLRRLIRQDLLCQVAVIARGVALRIVLENGGTLHGGLGEFDRLFDPRPENEVAEVLLEDLNRLLG